MPAAAATGTSPAQVFAAAWVLPVAGEPIRDGVVVVADERIAWVGPRVELPEACRNVPALGFPNSLIVPGLVNAHCHTHLTAALGRLPGSADRFDDWLRSVIAEQGRWTPEILCQSTRAGLDLMACSGITAVGDMVRDADPSLYAGGPIRGCLFHETIAFPAARAAAAEGAAQAWLDRVEDALGADRRFRLGVAPHAPYSVSPELMRRLGALARERRIPLAIHLAETRQEQRFLTHGDGGLDQLLRDRGTWDETWRPPDVSPVRLAADLGLLELRGSAVHVNYLSDRDIDLLNQGRLVPVWCPGSHRWFGHDEHPAARLLAAGVPLALGTDSLASNRQLDMVAEMRLAARAFPEVDPAAWLRAATLTAAQALAWDDEIGSLETGKAADLAIFSAGGQPVPDPHAALLSGALTLERGIVGGRESGRKPAQQGAAAVGGGFVLPGHR